MLVDGELDTPLPFKNQPSVERPTKATDSCLPIASLMGHAAPIVIWIAPAATGRTIQVSVTGRPVAQISASA